MSVLEQYLQARLDEEEARIRRMVALRALLASGATQRSIAAALGVSQPAVSQQVKASASVQEVPPAELVRAAGPVLRELAEARGFRRLAVFGSAARGDATVTSDVDLLIEPPPTATITDLVHLRETFEQVLGRSVDLLSYRGLKPGIDDDIRRELVLL